MADTHGKAAGKRPVGQSQNTTSTSRQPPADLSTILASSAEPHHGVSIQYQVRRLLRRGEKFRRTIDVAAAKQRHEPFPLVQDEDVQKNFPTFGESNVEFKTLYRVEGQQHTDSDNSPAFLEPFAASDDLVADMDKCTSLPGETSLDVLAYVPADKESGSRVRIRRKTKFYRPNGEVLKCKEHIYEFKTSYWSKLPRRSKQPPRPWQTDIVSLLTQDGERSARHVKRWMHSQHPPREYETSRQPYPWKPRRALTMEGVVEKMATVVDKQGLGRVNDQLPDDEKITTCIICRVDYADDEGFSDMIALPSCSDKHSLCKGCLMTWTSMQTIQKVRCPYCKHTLGSPKLAAQNIPNYMDMSAPIFHNDPEYSDWENFERSCADLDKHLAKNNSDEIPIHEGLFSQAWQVLVHEAPVPANDAPHLNQTNAPEYTLLHASFHQTISNLASNTSQLSAQDLYNNLKADFLNSLREQFFASGAADLYSTDEFFDILEGRQDPPFRFAFAKFSIKALNRVVQFVALRRCSREDCGEAGRAEGECGLHMHGDRLFYWINGIET